MAEIVLPPPTDLTVGPLLTNPLGYGERDPQFSWKLPATDHGLTQSAFQIICASNKSLLATNPDLWDSGWVDSSQSVFIDYTGKKLKSREQLYWKVRYKDLDNQPSEWSQPNWLEMALLEDNDWQARWIYLPEDNPAESSPTPHFRKTFTLEKKPLSRARAYITARGIFELQVNGKRVGSDYFQPEWTDYSKRSLFVTYDITNMLNKGENVIGAMVGEMWYTGVFGYSTQKNKYGEIPQLLLQLEIIYADGSSQTVVTDSTWRGTRGPITYSNIYHGERYDARRELGAWSEPGFNDSSWETIASNDWDTSVVVSPRPHQPVRIIDEMRPVSMSQQNENSYIFDLGQNITGWARIQVPSKADCVYTLRFAEMLKNDGTLYTESYRAAESTDTYTCAKDGTIVWEPRFTFHGFRYIELSGFPKGSEPDLSWITGIVLHNDMPMTGKFTSSNQRLNQLQNNIRWGQKGNFLAVPNDCPQRDERKGWTGDAQVFCSTANFNFNTLAFYSKWCQDLRDSQYPTGAIPYYAPNFPNRPQKVSSGWGDACVIVPWKVYQSFGYKRILEDNYSMMQEWIRFYQESPDTKNLIHRGFSFGDWLQPYSKMEDFRHGETDTALIGTAYFAHCADLISRSAEVLGKMKDAAKYRQLFEAIRTTFATQFFNSNGHLTTNHNTQTGYLLALAFDLLEIEQRPMAVEHLVQLILKEADGHLRTGFLGTPLIEPVLSRFGYRDLAYDILFDTSYPGWFYSIEQGATTIWERWNSYSKSDGFGDPKMNSFNHYAYGAIGEWIYQEIGGITPLNPGYRKVRIEIPHNIPLHSSSVTLETPQGRLSCQWEKKDNAIEVKLLVPPNTEAIYVYNDENSKIFGPGIHQWIQNQ